LGYNKVMDKQEQLQNELTELLRRGVGVAVVTVIETDKSVPQCPGAKMLVCDDGTVVGTVGGGPVEAFVQREALEVFKEGASRTAEYKLIKSETGMYCGGTMKFFIDIYPAKERMFILGAGHVGTATAKLADSIGMPVVIVDDRAEYADPSRLPDNCKVICEPFDSVFETLEILERDFVVIVSRCHAHDVICLEQAMKTSAEYIGLIGSKTKIKTIFGTLSKKGVKPQSDSRVYAPIGLDLGDHTIENIALSIVAEVTQIRTKRSGGHMRTRLDTGKEQAG